MEFEKRCRYCGKTFLGKGEAPYGICPDCEQEKYCDRCIYEMLYIIKLITVRDASLLQYFYAIKTFK